MKKTVLFKSEADNENVSHSEREEPDEVHKARTQFGAFGSEFGRTPAGVLTGRAPNKSPIKTER